MKISIHCVIDLNDQIIERLKVIRASHVAFSHNFDKPYDKQTSSVHFFSSDIKGKKGLPEVAYYMPGMNSKSLGDLSGFVEVERSNAIDTKNIYEIVY